MKKLTGVLLVLFTTNLYAGWDGYDGWSFYSLFKQTNISAEEYYPFLREDFSSYYGESYYAKHKFPNHQGNILAWSALLENWSLDDIERAIYYPNDFSWQNKTQAIERRAKKYITFAIKCSNALAFRNELNSWNYDEILRKERPNTDKLLIDGFNFLNSENNQQLQARYYYQIIRILHYAEMHKEAIELFDEKIHNKFPKDEIYYYTLDHIAGCYFSLGDYDKSACLFAEVFSNSLDRKKSAFESYNLCTNQNADGYAQVKGIEDEKNLLVLKSLRNFADEDINIRKLIELDANDNKVELLFMRALNNVERKVWPKNIGFGDETLPFLEDEFMSRKLFSIAEKQIQNERVTNKDFWHLSKSYLSFISNDIKSATDELEKVSTFPEQKASLSMLYKVFSWNELSESNENYLYSILKSLPANGNWIEGPENDLRNIILDRVAHLYYKNNHLAKAFLTHNPLDHVKNIHSLELLNDLEKLYYKLKKSNYENHLIYQKKEIQNYIDYINQQKGIYYLYEQEPAVALMYFDKITNLQERKLIPNTIFSNSIRECFTCSADDVMDDEVYKAEVFSFIKKDFTRKELAVYLIKLIELTSNKIQWKAKLANYLLANYYYNISNTGYYRGLLTENTNLGSGIFLSNTKTSKEYISEKSGYNLKDISWNKKLQKHYFKFSNVALKYYQHVIDNSTDKELNARCTFLMAKCELNEFYNSGSEDTFDLVYTYKGWNDKEYSAKVQLPKSRSYNLLKEKYTNTEFYKMIIKECSYFRYYSNNY